MVGNTLFVALLTAVLSRVGADIFDTQLYPGSTGIISYVPVPTKHTLIFAVTVMALLYGGVNLFRRFYLERYDRDVDGKLYPVECKPTRSLINALFSLSRRWGIVRPPRTTQIKQQHVFAGWAQAFTQQKHYWKRIGEGMVTITYYPDTDKYQLVLRTAAEVVLISHELTRNMVLFRDENQGRHVSRWSAIDFASLQPRADTFCLRWNNLGVADSFNTAFYKCTQPGCYTDADLFPQTLERDMVPARAKIMDFIGQSPSEVNKFVQTSRGGGDNCYPGYTGSQTLAPEFCSPYGCYPEQTCTYPPAYHQHSGCQNYCPTTASTPQVRGSPSQKQPSNWPPQTAPQSAPSSVLSSDPDSLSAAKQSRIRAPPSRMGALPSKMNKQSSRMVSGQPSRPDGQPSRTGGQPSRTGAHKSQLLSKSSSWKGERSHMNPGKSVIKTRKK